MHLPLHIEKSRDTNFEQFAYTHEIQETLLPRLKYRLQYQLTVIEMTNKE